MIFKDITPLLADGEAFAALVADWAAAPGGVDAVAGIEARGFILAAPLAVAPRRRLRPGAQGRQAARGGPSRRLRAGVRQATLEVTADAVRPGQRILVVDDVLATGGTVRAAAELLERGGAPRWSPYRC